MHVIIRERDPYKLCHANAIIMLVQPERVQCHYSRARRAIAASSVQNTAAGLGATPIPIEILGETIPALSLSLYNHVLPLAACKTNVLICPNKHHLVAPCDKKLLYMAASLR